jgi:hypothetical protein
MKGFWCIRRAGFTGHPGDARIGAPLTSVRGDSRLFVLSSHLFEAIDHFHKRQWSQNALFLDGMG